MSAQQGPLPYLKFGGVEVANAARTLSYLRRGLGGTDNGHWELGASDVASVLYRLNGGTCIEPDVFVHPAIDPAPWYDATEPGSSSFLGAVLLPFTGYDSTVKRTATQRMGGLGGGTLAAQYRMPRTWKFNAVLVSADDAGAEFGLRWLTAVLETGDCDTCSTNGLVVRLVAPPDDCSDDSLGEWTSYEVGLMDGPNEVAAAGAIGGCRDWVDVSWTMTSGNPFLYKQPVVCLEAQEFGTCADSPPVYQANQRIRTVLAPSQHPGNRRAMRMMPTPNLGVQTFGLKQRLSTHSRRALSGSFRDTYGPLEVCNICDFLSGASTAPCCVVDPPKRGILGAIFTMSSATGTGQILMESRADCTDESPLLSMSISGIAAGTTVVVDCARHTITVVAADGTESDGQDLIQLNAGQALEWIEVAACESAVCICIDDVSGVPGEQLTVEISTQLREG